MPMHKFDQVYVPKNSEDFNTIHVVLNVNKADNIERYEITLESGEDIPTADIPIILKEIEKASLKRMRLTLNDEWSLFLKTPLATKKILLNSDKTEAKLEEV